MMHLNKFEDHTQQNEARLKRQRILQQSKKLDKKEIWHGLIIAIFTGIAIAGIIVIALFPLATKKERIKYEQGTTYNGRIIRC